MIAGRGNFSGMGDIDWGSILETGVQVGGSILGSVLSPGKYPITPIGGNATYQAYGTQQDSGLDMTTLLLVGLGAFLLVKTMK